MSTRLRSDLRQGLEIARPRTLATLCIVNVDELPRTSAGKVLTRELVEGAGSRRRSFAP